MQATSDDTPQLLEFMEAKTLHDDADTQADDHQKKRDVLGVVDQQHSDNRQAAKSVQRDKTLEPRVVMHYRCLRHEDHRILISNATT